MDFARLLLVGVVIFAVLLIFFGGEFGGFNGSDEGSPGYQFGPVTSPKEETEDHEKEKVPEKAFFVGKKERTDFEHFSLSSDPFSVSFKKEKTFLGSMDEMRVERGFMKNKPQVISFNLTQSKLGKITSLQFDFRVEDTNSYGELYISLNGEKVYSNFPKHDRLYSVEVNKSLLGKQNRLKIYPESSGGKFWAPTTYILNNFTVKAKTLGRKKKSFDFSLSEKQASKFKSGRLILYPDEFKANGPLVVQLNGRDVYRETTEIPKRPSLWIDFKEGNVRKGRNKLTLFTEYNSSYSFNSGNMIIFWTADTENVTSKTLEVSSSQYDKLPGEIEFNIERIKGSPTSLNLNIVTAEGDENKVLIQDILKEGKTILIGLTKDDVSEGENTLEFTVGGKGGFYLSNFDVNY